MRLSAGAHAAVIAALVAATLLIIEMPWRFIDQETILRLDPANLLDGRWAHRGIGTAVAAETPLSSVTLDVSTVSRLPYLSADVEKTSDYSHLRINLRGSSSGLHPGRDPWQRPQLVVLSFGKDLYSIAYWPRKVFSIAEDFTWRDLAATFPVHPETSAFRVLLYNGADAGQFAVGGLEVTALQERALFIALRYLVVCLWVAYLLISASSLLRLRSKGTGKTLVLAAASCMILATVMPQPYYGGVVEALQQAADEVSRLSFSAHDQAAEDRVDPEPPARPERASPGAVAPSSEPEARAPGSQPAERARSDTKSGQSWALPEDVGFKQLSHFLGFFLLSLVSLFYFRSYSVRTVLSFLFLFAVCSEVLQLFVSTRSTSFTDLTVDVGGIVLGGIVHSTSFAMLTWLGRAWSSRAS